MAALLHSIRPGRYVELHMRFVLGFTALLLLSMGLVTSASTAPAELVCREVLLSGSFEMDATEYGAWLRPDKETPRANLVALHLEAAHVHLTQFEYLASVEAQTGGVPAADLEHVERDEDFEHTAVRIDVLRAHPQAQIRVLDTPGTGAARLVFDGTYALHPNASEAKGWDDADFVYYSNDDHRLAPFFDVPDDRMLASGHTATLTASGSMILWLHGFDLRVSASDGTHTYEGYPDEESQAMGPAEARTESWRDYVLTLSQDAAARLAWDGNVDFFSETLHVQGTGDLHIQERQDLETVDRAEANGTDVDEHVLTGAIILDARRTVHGDGSWVGLRVAPAPAAPASGVAPAEGAFPWLMVGGVLVALVGGGAAATPFALRAWRRRDPPPGPRPVDAPKSPDRPTEDAIGALLDEGQGLEAIPHLRREVRRRPKSAELRYALGVAYGQAGKVPAALIHFDYALRQDHAFLGMLVSDPRTASFRHEPEVARLVRRAARRFHDESHRGYV